MLSSIKYFCSGCDAIPENNESLRASDSCDPGWSDAHFVNMGCIYFGTEEMTIDDANEFCGLNNSAHLVEALTSSQMDFLVNQLQLLEIHTGHKNYWGGATDFGREGQWYWMNSLLPVEDFVWGTRQPYEGYDGNYLDFHSGFDYLGSVAVSHSSNKVPIFQKPR